MQRSDSRVVLELRGVLPSLVIAGVFFLHTLWGCQSSHEGGADTGRLVLRDSQRADYVDHHLALDVKLDVNRIEYSSDVTDIGRSQSPELPDWQLPDDVPVSEVSPPDVIMTEIVADVEYKEIVADVEYEEIVADVEYKEIVADVGQEEDDVKVGDLDVAGEADGCLPECTDGSCGSDGCGGVCGPCGPLEECVDGQCVQFPTGDPTLEIVSPLEQEYFDAQAGIGQVYVQFEVQNWSPWPAEGKSALCYVDGSKVGETPGGEFLFTGLSPGPHTLGCRLAVSGYGLTACGAQDSVVVKVTMPCATDSECDSDNFCYVSACHGAGDNPKKCVYGKDLSIPCCCQSQFDCDCSMLFNSCNAWPPVCEVCLSGP